jgi:glycine hydroxymethyltransferase
MLVDLRGTELTGKLAEETLDCAHITVNKNAVPFDPRPPAVTSGIRIGTPAVTTRGMREPEMDAIADLIARSLAHVGDAPALARIGAEVRDLCARFPIYRHRLAAAS